MDLSGMMGKMKEVQTKLKEAQDNLEHLTTTKEAGGGMVKVTVNGKKRLLKIEVEDSLINQDDKQMMLDLIVAASNLALEEVEAMAAEELKKTTQSMIPNIPGLDFSKMF